MTGAEARRASSMAFIGLSLAKTSASRRPRRCARESSRACSISGSASKSLLVFSSLTASGSALCFEPAAVFLGRAHVALLLLRECGSAVPPSSLAASSGRRPPRLDQAAAGSASPVAFGSRTANLREPCMRKCTSRRSSPSLRHGRAQAPVPLLASEPQLIGFPSSAVNPCGHARCHIGGDGQYQASTGSIAGSIWNGRRSGAVSGVLRPQSLKIFFQYPRVHRPR